MGNFFSDFTKGVFGQNDIPDLRRFSGASMVQDWADNAPQLAGANLAYNQAYAPGAARLSRQLEDIYSPGITGLRDSTTKNVQDQLNLGGSLPADVAQVIRQNGLEGSTRMAGGGGISGAGRNLVARDLGLTSLELQNQRLSRAMGYVRSSPMPQLSQGMSPSEFVQTNLAGIQSGNQADIYNSALKSSNNQNMIKSLMQYAMMAMGIPAMGGQNGGVNPTAAAGGAGGGWSQPADFSQYGSLSLGG